VLLADEPTAELDPGNRNRILEVLVSSATRLVVVASNDPEVIAACPRVLELHDGRLSVPGPS
jgi:putative ABC transport system ATP-binding protein